MILRSLFVSKLQELFKAINNCNVFKFHNHIFDNKKIIGDYQEWSGYCQVQSSITYNSYRQIRGNLLCQCI